jgi:thioredoxin 1
MSELIISADDFDSKVKNATGPVLVDFFADWCGPCKIVAPVIEQLAKDFEGKAGVYKINTDNAQALATSLGIRGIPTLIFFKGGQEVNRVVGVTSAENLAAELNKMM